MIRWLSLGTACSFFAALHAQEQFGLVHGNYAGTDAVALNPARMAGQWAWMDLNIIGADLFVWNDHVYVSTADRTVIGEMRESIRTANGDGFKLGASLDAGGRHAFVSARVAGPAVARSLGRGSIGAHISTRSYTSITGVGLDVANYAYNGLGYLPQHGVSYEDDALRIVSAGWTQIGLSYAHILQARDFNLFSAGITAKYLIGHYGAGLAMERLRYSVMDTSRLVIEAASGVYGMAGPAVSAGRGIGLDLGVSYERTIDEADGYIPHKSSGGCDPLAYRYRIGLSLIDIGGIGFSNAMAGSFSSSTAAWPDYNAIDVNGQEGVDSLLNTSLTQFQSTDQFSVGLPTAIALQYDQRIAEHVYVAADVIQNLSFPGTMRLRRTNTVAVVPRAEWRRFELAVPVVIHEYDLKRPSVGLAIRLNNISVGSDNLLPLIRRMPAYGFDVYFRVKWTIFRSPICRGKKKATHRAGDHTAMPCMMPK